MVNSLVPKKIQEWSKENPSLYIWSSQNLFRILTSRLRVLPNVMTIGEMKCGTTSLYNYLRLHPNFFVSSKKELYFFSKDPVYNTGINWYKSFFPTILTKNYFEKIKKQKMMIYEGTTDYLFQSNAPDRIAKLLPKTKFLVILRNPVDRAFSHYHHNVNNGFENETTFETAIKLEPKRLLEYENLGLTNTRWSAYSYLKRGIYVDSLKRWLKYFNKNQFLIIKNEELGKDPQKILDSICNFLEIPKFEKFNWEKSMIGKYNSKMNLKTREFLIEYYRPHNKKLSELLELDFDWDK